MQTAWIILALASFAMDGSSADHPPRAAARCTISFKVGDSCTASCPESSVETPEPDCCSGPVTERAERHEPWELTLPQAIQIALENSDFVRVVTVDKPLPAQAFPLVAALQAGTDADACADAAPIVIAKLKAADESGRFKAEAMALVRSVEQQYWKLYTAHAHYENAKLAAGIAEEVISKEADDYACYHGTCVELVDTSVRLEWICDDVARGARSVVEQEQRLRAIMGLASSDNRRIVPCTEPVAEWIAPGLKSALKKENRAQRKLNKNNDSRSGNPTSSDSPGQLVREVRADYKRYQKQRKTASADEKRLDIRSRSYRAGRVTGAHLLDFVRQYAASSAAEAGCLATYNITLAAVCEQSGTLLDYRDIVVAEGPDTSPAPTAKRDDAARTTSFEQGAVTVDEVLDIEAIPESDEKMMCCPAETDVPEGNPKTAVFSVSLGGFIWELRFGDHAQPAPQGK
jgi:hypothetical protein